MPFNQFDEVDNIHNEQQRSKNGSLRHTTKKTSDERSETYILCPTDEIRPKPPMSSAVDAEGLLQTLQQDVVIDGVEGCRQIE